MSFTGALSHFDDATDDVLIGARFQRRYDPGMDEVLLEKQLRTHRKRGVITWQRQLVNQHGKVVQEGVSLTLVECRAAREQSEDENRP